MKWLLLFSILLSARPTSAQETCACKAQLMRIQIDSAYLNQTVTSQDKLNKIIAPLSSYMHTDDFKQKFLGDYKIKSMGFPFSRAVCQEEKDQGDPKFKNVDCDNWMLCADEAVALEVKKEVCSTLPCALIVGSARMGQCPSEGRAMPSMLHFTEPVGLKKIELTPSGLTSQGNRIRACFTISQLEASLGVGIEFLKDPAIKYDDLGLSNFNLKLDTAREVCMSGKVDLASKEPISDLSIEKTSENIISDAMINQALSGAKLRGLSGYSEATLNIIKLTAAPALARHFRPSIERALLDALGNTFKTQVGKFVGTLTNADAGTFVSNSDGLLSELGVANISLRKYVSLLECSILKAEGKIVPDEHPCFSDYFPQISGKPLKFKQIPHPVKAAQYLQEISRRYDQATSEVLRSQLAGFADRLTSLGLSTVYGAQVKPVVDGIKGNQLKSSLLKNIQLLSDFGNGSSSTGINLMVPETCDTTNPSPHMDKSLPNCPIQAYIDLNEVNKVLAAMYASGQLCHSGKGDFVSQGRNRDGSPIGTGCQFIVEEDDKGLRCFLNGPPKLSFDRSTNGYKVDFKTKECFRGSVILGQGKIAGDINFELGFTPGICGRGEFCLQNGTADWNVVPGTARYALSERSWFNGIVRKTIDKKLNGLVSQSIRIPLSTETGPLSLVPLEAEGRVDVGPGYFGACLKLQKK